ncbi:MAG: hypothetical protein ABSG43_01045 [Solirubrobacteraceae bacterium]|jgi:hypothetical protein
MTAADIEYGGIVTITLATAGWAGAVAWRRLAAPDRRGYAIPAGIAAASFWLALLAIAILSTHTADLIGEILRYTLGAGGSFTAGVYFIRGRRGASGDSAQRLIEPLMTFAAASIVMTVGLRVAATVPGLQLLRTAGLNGTPPPGAGAITSLIGTLTNYWIWMIGAGLGFVGALVIGLMIFGDRRWPEHLFRIVGGVLLLLVALPAVLA